MLWCPRVTQGRLTHPEQWHLTSIRLITTDAKFRRDILMQQLGPLSRENIPTEHTTLYIDVRDYMLYINIMLLCLNKLSNTCSL